MPLKKINPSSVLSAVLMGISFLIMFLWLASPASIVGWFQARSSAPFRFNSAFMLFFIALAIWLMNADPLTDKIKRAIGYILLPSLIIGTATLIEFVFRINIGIDDLFVNHVEKTNGIYDGRMRLLPLVVMLTAAISVLYIIRQKFLVPFLLISTSLFVTFFLMLDAMVGTNIFNYSAEYHNMSYMAGLNFILLLLSIILSRPLKAVVNTFSIKLSAYYLLALFALMVVFFSFYENHQLQEKVDQESESQYKLISNAQLCNDAFVRLENYWRDYLVQGDSAGLAAYLQQVTATRKTILSLKQAASAPSMLQHDADALLHLLSLHSQGVVPAMATIKQADRFEIFSQKNKYINNAISILSRIGMQKTAAEIASLKKHQQLSRQYLEIFLLFGAIAIIILFVGLAIIISNFKKRAAAEEELKQLNEVQEQQIAEATQEIKNKELRFETLVQNMNEGVQIIGFDWKYIYANESVARRSHYMPSKDVIGRNFHDQFPGIESTDLYKSMQRCMIDREASSFEFQFTYANGSKKWFLISIEPVPEGMLTITTDIDEVKASQKTLNDYKNALDAASIITITDALGNITYVNQKFLDVSGYTEAELIGQNHRMVNSGIHDKSYFKQLWDTIQAGKVWRGEVCNRNKDGSLIWFDAVIVPFMDDENIPYQYMAIRNDISARKKTEAENEKIRKDLQKRAEELQRSNAELEQYAYAASHDLQEPARMVSSFMSLLQKKYADKLDENAQTYIKFAKEGALRMRTLILDMLEIGRLGREDSKKEPVDLNEVLQQTMLQLQEQVQKQQAKVIIDKMPVVPGYGSKLTQVFVNLIGNALKFKGSENTEVHVSVEEQEAFWQFCVADNGIGIPKEHFDDIFVIFHRLNRKEEYQGNGIGLSIVKKIVLLHHGQIWVESEPGKGTQFYFTLPKQ